MTLWTIVVLGICCSLTATAAGAHTNLAVLAQFSVDYGAHDADSPPALSPSQLFYDVDAGARIETAVPVVNPSSTQAWDLRAARFTITLGIRPANDTNAPFDLHSDEQALLNAHGGSLRLYENCGASADDNATPVYPCDTPLHVYQTPTNASIVSATRDFAWGRIYTIDVFLTPDPSVDGVWLAPGHVLWLAYVGAVPSSVGDGQANATYHHTMPVGGAVNASMGLALVDTHNLLGHDWTSWQRGDALADTFYAGLQYPSPGFVIVGAIHAANETRPPTNHTPSTGHHWPSGLDDHASPAAGPPALLSVTGTVTIIVVCSGLALCCLGVTIMLGMGIIRRRRRRAERLGMDYQPSDFEDSTSALSVDGAGVYMDQELQRKTTSFASQRPMALPSQRLHGSSGSDHS